MGGLPPLTGPPAAAGMPPPDAMRRCSEPNSTVERLGAVRNGPHSGCPFGRSCSASPRSALACDPEGAILDACKHGESRTLEAYRNVLDDHFPEIVREGVLRRFERVNSTHKANRDCRAPRPVGGAVASPGAQADQH